MKDLIGHNDEFSEPCKCVCHDVHIWASRDCACCSSHDIKYMKGGIINEYQLYYSQMRAMGFFKESKGKK